MKIIKNTILVAILVSGLTITTIAKDLESDNLGGFGVITLSPDTDAGTINGHKFKGSGMIGLIGGKKNSLSDTIGTYGGFDMSYNTTDEDGNSKPIYGYRLFNLGITYSPIEKLTFMSGVGYSWEFAEFIETEHKMSEETNSNINFNMELMYTITDSWGVVVGYNTAPSAMNYGFSFSF